MERSQKPNFDMVSVYAYSDRSQAENRASWRGFFSYFLSTLLEIDSEDAEALVTECVTNNPEDLLTTPEDTLESRMWTISSEFAQTIGLSAEFGLAGMLDYNPPTRFHPIGSRREQMSQTQTLTLWLSRLQSLQKEEPFQVLAGQWKEMIEQVLSQDEEEESSAFAEPA